MVHEVAILTPEKVAVSYRVARVASRIYAQFIDLILVVVVNMIFSSIVVAGVALLLPNLASLLTPVVIIFDSISWLLYFTIFEGLWNGSTPGKRMMNIRVRCADGTPVSFSAALYRNLMRPADFLPFAYLLGIVMLFLNEKSQRFGDLAANTMVTYDKVELPIFQPAPHHVGIHPFEANVGELRRMTPLQYHALKRLADRFPELGRPAQDKLLAEVWEPFREEMGIEPIQNVHDIYLIEAVVMKYGRQHKLI